MSTFGDFMIDEAVKKDQELQRLRRVNTELLRVLGAIDAFWGDGVCDAAIHPGAYLAEEDVPIRDVVHLAVNLAKGIVRP